MDLAFHTNPKLPNESVLNVATMSSLPASSSFI